MSPAERAVIHAAVVWFTARLLPTDGAVYHQACRALADAVAIMGGKPVEQPAVPPSAAAIDASIELVARLRSRRP